jgi:hypothetical protein
VATEIRTTEGTVALILHQDGACEPTAQLTVFTDDSYPSGVLAIDGMSRILEVDLNMLNEFFELIKAKTRKSKICRSN